MTTLAGDRRVRRTRAALQQAMVELVNEQGYEAISVDGLANRADVTRATFYAHYASKAELLTAVVDSFADDVIAELADPAAVSEHGGRIGLLLERARASADVLRIIVRGEGDGVPLRHFTRRVEQVLSAESATAGSAATRPGIDPDLLVRLRAAHIVAAVGWFLDHDGCDPEEVARAVNLVAEQGWRRPPGEGSGPEVCP